jgi:cell division protein ZapA (FtsZ GTPase activity inhibitor)
MIVATSTVRDLLVQARTSLDAALATIEQDLQAATDDIHAARLLVSTALLTSDEYAVPTRWRLIR